MVLQVYINGQIGYECQQKFPFPWAFAKLPFMAKNCAFVTPAKAGTPKGSPLGNPGEGRGRILDRLDFGKALTFPRGRGLG